MYRKGVEGKSKEENDALKQPFLQDRALLRKRLLKGAEIASSLFGAGKTQFAVIGYGFGGLFALDLARTGFSLEGVVSVYGHFNPPTDLSTQWKTKKILLLHGFNDPIVPISEMLPFMEEAKKAHLDLHIHLYKDTLYAFMNSMAYDPSSGIAYQTVSARQAWKDTKDFLDEIFLI